MRAGVCVSTMMIGTDILVTIAMIVVWELPLYVPVIFFCVFGFVDGVFWTANLTKIPKGGWYALVVAAIVSTFSYLWFFGTSIKRQIAIEHMASPLPLSLATTGLLPKIVSVLSSI